MKKEFLDLGRQPITNKFLSEDEFEGEFFYDLKVVFDEETKLVSIQEFVPPEMMFNEEYAYTTSLSTPMINHFKQAAETLQMKFTPKKVLEIGSNDGPFISNFSKMDSVCVEPCGNFAEITNGMGYQTYDEFWTTDLADKIKDSNGYMDLIYAANCICHIQDLDDAFTAVKNLLKPSGVFVFEDPSLIRMLERGSYDQIYDEHAHVFSVIALDNILRKNGLKIFSVDNLSVHGGSNRIYASHIDSGTVGDSVKQNINEEMVFGLDQLETYQIFADRVKTSKEVLNRKLSNLTKNGKRIVSIGATSKSSTVFNYCGIDSSLIECVTDTTPAKQGLFTPGSHIPVVSRDSVNLNDYDYAFLGAWNFKEVIANKESEFVKNGGKFITHVPEVMEFN
jgi:methylation protein EvaC